MDESEWRSSVFPICLDSPNLCVPLVFPSRTLQFIYHFRVSLVYQAAEVLLAIGPIASTPSKSLSLFKLPALLRYLVCRQELWFCNMPLVLAQDSSSIS